MLRLGVWSIGEEPVAVQFWVVKDGHATVLKLAHDEAFKAHSPGTVLTALMLRHFLNKEHVTRIDFGRGDDATSRAGPRGGSASGCCWSIRGDRRERSRCCAIRSAEFAARIANNLNDRFAYQWPQARRYLSI